MATSIRAARSRIAPFALATSIVLAAAPAAAQERADSGRAVCFGVSFDRGCRAMVQYEVGYLVVAAGEAPRLERARQRPRSDYSAALVGGGVMFRTAPATTLGIVYQARPGDWHGTRAIGVRWGRQLRATNRIDVTAGTVFFPLIGDSVHLSRRGSSEGAFAEVALHGSNMLTLVVRDEAYPRSSGVSGGNLVFAGARAEALPAAIITLAGGLLVAVAVGLTGPGW